MREGLSFTGNSISILANMPYCSSCGSPIPEGQGSSCSMCYGDPWYGRDGYALRELERQQEEEEHRKQAEIDEQIQNLTEEEIRSLSLSEE